MVRASLSAEFAVPITVILADDHSILREGLRSVLEPNPEIEVVGEADNGRDTVALARRLEPDLVVMDITMPDLNGIDATRKLGELGLGCKVLALSGHSEELYVRGMLQAGAAGYMLKDCASDEVVQAIQEIMRGKMYVSPQIASMVVADYASQLGGPAAGPSLSTREREVLQLIAEGMRTANIADRLSVSVKTIESHRRNLMEKLDVRTVAGLTKYAIRQGLTSVDE